ncbi:MAG: hypothetical protein HDT30_04515 [Clostridiales bacterium]|nr:hypothetical protein [Clostridiales bacterium]
MLKAEDISAEKIKSGVGGYKKRETEEYIGTLRREYEVLLKENIELKDKLSVLSEGVQYYKNMEKSLQKALVLAEKTTSETMQAAEVKAVAMEKEAQSRANAITKEAQIRADSYEKEVKMRADSYEKDKRIQADSYEKDIRMQADSYKKEADDKAKNIIHDAKQTADQEIASANEELRRIHSQIMTLIQQYEQYKSQYKQLATAQMQVLESEAYNLDAPILRAIRPIEENVVSLNENLTEADQDTIDSSQEIVKAIETPIQTENPEEEKKIYVDARGEVVEVHEFREVTGPGSDSTVDPWDIDPEEDVVDDFDDFTQEYEGPYSFTEDNIPVNDLNINVPVSDSNVNVPVNDLNVNMPVSDSNVNIPVNDLDTNITINDSNMAMAQDVTFDTVQETEIPVQTNLVEDTISIPESEDVLKDVSQTAPIEEENSNSSNIAEETLQEVESTPVPIENTKVTQHNNGISLEEMKRIEKMQLERLREQEEQQLAMLKSEHYHNYSQSAPSKEQEQKKEQDPANIFRALHKNDDSEPTITLQDLKQQQELENSPVDLPKATVQSLEEEQPKKETPPPLMDDFLSFEPLDMTKKDTKISKETITFNKPEKANSAEDDFFHQFSEQSESAFRTTPNVEEGNSLDFEMDNNQNIYGSKQGETPKFKSFREFESEL